MKIKVKQLVLFLSLVYLVLFGATYSINAAVQYQKCYKEDNCTVGEFLYDDSYVPIATASCVLTSRFPDSSIFLNSVDMDSASDGWYSYSFTATGSAGLYRSQICCTAGTDYLCLDKTFEVEASSSALTKQDVADAVWDESRSAHTQLGSFGEALQNIVPSTSDIASAVWGYSGRTLNNFGSLPSDVWNYSTKTLSSFGSLVSSIWSNNERTLTSSGVDTSLLAKKTDVDDLKKEVAYSQSLLEKTVNKPVIKNFLEEEQNVDLESKLNQSQLLLTELLADSYSVDSKLGMLDLKWKEFDEKKLTLVLKEINKSNSSISDSTKKIKELWNLALADSLNSQVESLRSRTAVIESDLKVEGKSKIVKEDLLSLGESLNSFIETLGTASDKDGKETLYGKINEVKTLANTFDLYLSDVDKLLINWRKIELSEMQKKTDVIASDLAKINKLPRSMIVISSRPEDSLSKKLKNRLLSIKGTIEANKKLLAKITDKPFSSSWLEEGSVVFKTLLTNPSTRISQSVPLKYYLPAETKKEDIIEVDDGLEVNYDVEKRQLYVEGEFTLAPSESKVVSVRVQDIWSISEEIIESLRQQAEELVKPLEKTSYFGQGVTIKSNINVSLDKILNNQKSAVTPENKIKNYFEAQIELKGIKDQIKNLQDLVTQSGSFSSMTGFVGGAQAVSVWGLIIVMVAGFVFLVIYMKILRGSGSTGSKPVFKAVDSIGREQMIKFAVIFFILGSTISFLASFVVLKVLSIRQPSVNYVSVKTEQLQRLDEAKIVSPIPNETVLGTETKPKQENKYVIVTDLSGSYLRIRKTPNGEVIGKAYSGEKYPILKEKDGWTQIELQDSTGWVSSEFVLQRQ